MHITRDKAKFDPYAAYSTVAYSRSAVDYPPDSSVDYPYTSSLDDKVYTSSQKPSPAPAYYPLSILIVAFWVILIVVELFLLERAVAVASTSVQQPWYYSNGGLPSLLLTAFTQGHGPVTAMHLSRLAVSALRSPRTSPKTWFELFWLTDKQWAGPVGILKTLNNTIKLHVRLSITSITFSIVCLITLPTPIVLNHAYPIKTIDVHIRRNFAPNTLTPSKLAVIDAYNQVGVGAGAWSLNQTLFELFNGTTFISPGTPRNDSANDLFFAGDVEGMDMNLPGLRLQGGCRATQDQDGLGDYTAFTAFCQKQLTVTDQGTLILNSPSLALNLSYCTTGSWTQLASPSNTSAFMWFENTNTTGMIRGDLTKGLVRCDSYLTAGTASLYGANLTYEHFKQDNGLLNSSQGGEPMLDPLYLTIYHLSTAGKAGDEAIQGQLINTLGYTEEAVDGAPYYRSPSLDDFATSMWRGVSYMTISLALLSRSTNETYPATEHFLIAGRTRVVSFHIGALALLATWLLCMLGLTVAMWRPNSLGGSLDSYTTARLAADRIDLVSGCGGAMEENELLMERFEPGENTRGLH